MNVKDRSPFQWAACAVIGPNNFKTLQTHFHNNSLVRFTLISAALISQILGLLLVCFLGIVLGSVLFGLLR
jgi:uncharacterized membrane protein SpoIIM required for sporulation